MSKKVSKFCFDESAFNFLRTEKKCIGHIVSLKIGCEEFNANLSLRKPTDFEVESAVAAICEVEWGGGLAEHLTFSCQISTANKTLAETLLMNTLDSTEVIVTFVVYQYDDDARKYFVAVKGEELEGNLFEDNGMLSFEVDSQPSDRVQLPRNYNLNFEVVPAEKEQDIEIATNLENKFVANWGVTVEQNPTDELFLNILLTKEKCKAFLFIFDKEYKMSFLKKFYQPGYNYDENQDIIQNIYYILNTSKNFHSFQKDLGLEISGYFTKNKESVEELKKQICKNIEKYESRVKLTNIDEGTRISDSRLQFKLKFELKQKKYKKPEQIFITFDSSVLNKIIIDKIAGTK